MPLQGDMRKLGKLKETLERLARLPSKVAPFAATRINVLLDSQFANATDPYGAPLARNAPATIARKGFDHPMTETGESHGSTIAKPLPGAGISITSTQKVLWNMKPGPNRPARPMLPMRGLPQSWKQALKDAALDALQKAIK